MPHTPSTRRRPTRRSRRIRVTTQTDEQSTARLAQVLTSAALHQARREAEAEAEHTRRHTASEATVEPDLATSQGVDRA